MPDAIIIGSGSAAKHHSKALQQLGFKIYFVTSRKLDNELTFKVLAKAIESVEPFLVVIASETYKHLDSINELSKIGYSGYVVCEKPLFLLGKKLDISNFKKFRVGYNLRYDAGLIKLKHILTSQSKEIYLVLSYYGRNLETWRPNRNHRKSYSSYSEKGGGVLWDLSHDLDFAFWLFGDLDLINTYGGRVSKVTVDSSDFWDIRYSVRNQKTIGQLTLNYLDRNPERTIKIITKKETFTLDMIKNEIYADSIKIWEGKPENSTFYDMHFDILKNEKDSACDLAEAIKLENFINLAIEINSRENDRQ